MSQRGGFGGHFGAGSSSHPQGPNLNDEWCDSPAWDAADIRNTLGININVSDN